MSQAAQNQPLSVESLPCLVHQGVPVITSDLLARFYETTSVRIRTNFNRNKARFVEGRHFFALSGQDLQAFKGDVSKRYATGGDGVAVLPHLNGGRITLWTERGAARHAKMLETERAWEVFEMLEDNYFRRHAQGMCKLHIPNDDRLSTAKERNPLAQLVNRYVGLAGSPSRETYKAVWTKIHAVFGIKDVRELRVSQIPQAMAFVQALIDARSIPAPEAPALPAKRYAETWPKLPRNPLFFDAARQDFYLRYLEMERALDASLELAHAPFARNEALTDDVGNLRMDLRRQAQCGMDTMRAGANMVMESLTCLKHVHGVILQMP